MRWTNEGGWDRVLRVVVGLALAGVGLGLSGAWQIVLYVAAALALVTGLFGVCPLYLPFGVRTCPVPERRH